jgi:hypothetical protein
MLYVAPVHHQEGVEHGRILSASFCSLIEISIERASFLRQSGRIWTCPLAVASVTSGSIATGSDCSSSCSSSDLTWPRLSVRQLRKSFQYRGRICQIAGSVQNFH